MKLKQQIIKQLETNDFPNLKFLYSDEVLDISSAFLLELLEEEKTEFYNRLKTKNEDITFEIFDTESNLNFFWSLLNHLNNIKSSEKIRKIIDDFEPKLMEFSNEISYNKRNYEMLEFLLKNGNLDEEQSKIIFDDIKSYKIRGINLDEEAQSELKKINLELSDLSTKFSNNVLDSEKEFHYNLKDDEFIKEFSKSDLDNAKNLAKSKGETGFSFDSSPSSYISIIKYCSNSQIRKLFFESRNSFASSGKYDNREIVLKIIKLKNKKSKILGYNNYSELSLALKMAESPTQVIDLLTGISEKAKTKSKKEIEEIKDYFDLKEINPWDMGYYSRILKEKKYKLDDKKFKEYFEFENTKDALFNVVNKLYGIEMKKIDFSLKDDFLYDEKIELYKVYKGDKFISYFIGDYFFNENKRSGAWADELRLRYLNKKSIVLNNMSLVKSDKGEILLTLGEVQTMFHEFGHAIHSMLSKSKHSDLSGFGVERDFVELPSQLLEKWCSESISINNVAKHYKTGNSLPLDMIKSLENLKYFGTGNFVLGQNIYAICDMMFHSGEEFKDVDDLDKKFLNKVNSLSLFQKDENYKMYCSFSHIFAGGYSAGYYSYMWADIIVDEIWQVFKENGIFNYQTANRFENTILGAGSIKKASQMFYDFMGRKVNIDAFLKEKGI